MKFYQRQLVTHKKFQYGFILCMGIFGGILGALNSWIQTYAVQQDPTHVVFKHGLVVGGLLLLFCTPIALASLIFTNRVAGPLNRLQRHMEAAASGDVRSDLKFRDHDLFREIEEPYNKILAKLRNS